MEPPHLTERQRKWFASVQSGLELDTGKSLGQWVEIARTCPETSPRARLRWFKETHGLLQNRASYVLGEAFPTATPWKDSESLIEALWTDPTSRALYDAVADAVGQLPGEVVLGPRKGFTAFSRKLQFAAVRPVKGGAARLGLAVEPEADGRLTAPRNEGWSERLLAVLPLASLADVDDRVERLLAAAWARS